jgi:NADH-quinone oxidoreductase subunit J
MTDFGFYLTAAVITVAALFTVRSHNMVRAVLWLALTLLGTAALYAQWDEPFLAGVQVLTYVGGVVTLMIFGVMVTRRHENLAAAAENDTDERGLIIALALLVVLGAATWRTPMAEPTAAVTVAGVEPVARALLDEDLLAFELLSVLLLAAIVGAVVLARRTDDAAEPLEARAPAGPQEQPR